MNVQVIPLQQGAEKIGQYLHLDPEELLRYAAMDTLGGYPEKWYVGSLFGVEGSFLYAIARMRRPEVIVEYGTHRGCSAAHLALACRDNEMGKLYSVDILGGTGGDIPEDLLPYVELVTADGIEWAKSSLPEGTSMVFEDGPHSIEFCRDVIRATIDSPNSSQDLVVLWHDACHFLVGEAVSAGAQAAVGDHLSVLIEPSDCGFAIWKS